MPGTAVPLRSAQSLPGEAHNSETCRQVPGEPAGGGFLNPAGTRSSNRAPVSSGLVTGQIDHLAQRLRALVSLGDMVPGRMTASDTGRLASVDDHCMTGRKCAEIRR